MFESIGNFFKRIVKPENKELGSKDDAKERLHLVLMQDRANVSADFLELMKQEIIDVIKKYIVVDEASIDVRLTNKQNEDGTNGAPALYANIPIINIKNDMKAEKIKEFEGVNFNQKLEEAKKEEEKKEKVEETITEMVNGIEDKQEDEKKESEEQVDDNENEIKNDESKEDLEDKEENNKKTKEKNSGKKGKKNKKKKKEQQKSEKFETEIAEEEAEALEDDDDENDDDVTFDDLLKVAEQEDMKKVVKGN